MIPGVNLEAIPAEERTPVLEEILAGRDGIELDSDLLADAGSSAGSPGSTGPAGSPAPPGDDGNAPADAAGPVPADEDAEPSHPERYTPEHEAIAIRVRMMAVSHRIKLAFTGGREARQVLARDPVRLVQRCVLMNPRMSLEEVLAVAKNRSLHGQLLRQIAEQRDWVRQYSIRQALVMNPKTPLQIALKLMGGLHERDVRVLAKSRNVSSVVQAQARRALLRKQG